MKKVLCILTFFFLITAFFCKSVFAESDYVLPYPSAMPGNLSYKFHLISESIFKFWYFGDFGQFEYNLKQSDKYLVEAKTLFEYKQYLLGRRALKKSDDYFIKILPALVKAKNNNKNIQEKYYVYKQASLKHTEVLDFLNKEIPNTFVWSPEKSLPEVLNLRSDINYSVKIRKTYL